MERSIKRRSDTSFLRRRRKPMALDGKIQGKPYGIVGLKLVSIDYGLCRTFTKLQPSSQTDRTRRD